MTRRPFRLRFADRSGRTVLSQVATTDRTLALPPPPPSLVPTYDPPLQPTLYAPLAFTVGTETTTTTSAASGRAACCRPCARDDVLRAGRALRPAVGGGGVRLVASTTDPSGRAMVVTLRPDRGGALHVSARPSPDTRRRRRGGHVPHGPRRGLPRLRRPAPGDRSPGRRLLQLGRQRELRRRALRRPRRAGRHDALPQRAAGRLLPAGLVRLLAPVRLPARPRPSWPASAWPPTVPTPGRPTSRRPSSTTSSPPARRAGDRRADRHHRPPPRAAGVGDRPDARPRDGAGRDGRLLRAQGPPGPARPRRATTCRCAPTGSRAGASCPATSCATSSAACKARGLRVLFYFRAFVANDVGRNGGRRRVRRGAAPRRRRAHGRRRPTSSATHFGGTSALIDFTNPARGSLVGARDPPRAGPRRRRLHAGLRRAGHAGHGLRRRQPRAEMHNRYPALFHRARRGGPRRLRARAPAPRPFFFTRAGYTGRPGAAAYENANFPGDETTDWTRSSGLASLSPDMLNRAVGGAYGFTTDIGGYFDVRIQPDHEGALPALGRAGGAVAVLPPARLAHRRRPHAVELRRRDRADLPRADAAAPARRAAHPAAVARRPCGPACRPRGRCGWPRPGSRARRARTSSGCWATTCSWRRWWSAARGRGPSSSRAAAGATGRPARPSAGRPSADRRAARAAALVRALRHPAARAGGRT